ncbi:colicin-like bacteriocin tRNase domain-containing protein [Enterobacter oligotrophicus]
MFFFFKRKQGVYMSDGKNAPADPGDTLVVWGNRPDWGQPGAGESIGINPDFDPNTGNGWLPAEDGYTEALPVGVPANVQSAINQVKSVATNRGLMSADLWKLKPAVGYPWNPKAARDPIFVYFPAQTVSNTDLSSGRLPAKVPVHTRIQDDVRGGVQYICATGSGSSSHNLPVIKARAVGRSYTVGHLPGPMSPYTFSFSANAPRGEPRFTRAESKASGLHPAGFTVGANTTDCIVVFPQGSGLQPLYFAMVVGLPAGPLKLRQTAENQARAKADDAAKAKAAAEAKAKAEAEARAKAEREALFAKAGVKPAPVYTPQMVTGANSAMKAPGAMVLNQSPGTLQMALAGAGSLTLSGAAEKTILNTILSSVKTLGKAAPGGYVISAIFHSPKAGEGSDRVPGRDLEAMFALNAQHIAGQGVKIEPGVKSVNLPVRGQLVISNGQRALQLLKTGNSSIPAAVPVLNAVRDAATGLDKITVPSVAGAPARTILVNPAPAPSKSSNTGNQKPVPVTPVHTGTEIKPVETLVTTTTPAVDAGGLRDFIYWRPDAAGTGVEPVYVMLNDPLDSGRFTRKQLDRKYLKHANDFGVNDTKKNRATLTKFRDAIEAHLADKRTVEKGTYLHEKESKVFFNPKTNNVVILKQNGDFISGWHLTVGTPQYEVYIKTGNLK